MNSNLDTMKTDMKTLVKDAQQLFHEAGSATGQKADELRARGLTLLDKAAGSAQHAQDVAIETGKGIVASADELVKENSWKAVAISGTVGALAGYLIARR